MATLDGKWVWVWRWQRCDGGDAGRVAERLVAAGCRGALVKAHDGPHWFDQGRPWREIARDLKASGLAVGGWGYFYGRDIAGEAQRAVETVGYGEADLFVLDVESEFEGPDGAIGAEALCRAVRDGVGAAYPLYFSSFALARYHRSFPYAVFAAHCAGAAPQAYWNAFGRPVEAVLPETYADYAALGIPPQRLFPAAGLYGQGSVPYPSPESVLAFVGEAAARGSVGVSFWSYEHMDEAMWQAVAAAAAPVEEGNAMSSREYAEVSQRLGELTVRLERLEADVGSLRAPISIGAPRTYTVKPGDTLSGIAVSLGLPGWHALFEANRLVIGDDPNLIRPGQVLVIP